jgi:hypothetical protein
MKTIITIVVFTILKFSVFGNDGIYLTRGGIIYPTKETKISLDKEILSFTVRDKVAQVDIQFEFNNLENVERKLLVGFQAPSAAGDVSNQISNTNQISNFQILNGGQILAYQLKVAECEDCELKEPKAFHFPQGEMGVFVFLFEVTFKPGINKINHSYSFPASSNVVMNQFYNYILTTGAKWANGIIKELILHVDMGTNKYFYVSDIFGQKANWSIIGSGKVTNKKFDYIGNDSCRMVRVLSGKLQISIKDFKPIKNIEFGIINEYSFISTPTDFMRTENDKVLGLGNLSLERTYTKDEFKLLRNTVYAQYGYAFKSKDLQDYFSQFEWYIPDPNLTMDQIVLTEKEKKFIEELLKRENK